MPKNLFNAFLFPWLDWFPPCGEPDDENAAYMLWVSRGFWWKPEKALGDVFPVGKKPKVGEEGVAK